VFRNESLNPRETIMGLLFKAYKTSLDKDAHKKLTRFKRMHVRHAPVAEVDRGIDLLESLSRAEHQHVRKPATKSADTATAVLRPFFQSKLDMAALLHATDPISIDVLHRALPLRVAKIAY
jgi:hypothetical protein